ncbi:MAG: septum formation inhibitor Maf [Eudoraea sp.]|uniref:septum formation inhibitor Maf n=1 Tax=Eudoraea sp. TaxID=1979955 RepID=UPI003C78DB78
MRILISKILLAFLILAAPFVFISCEIKASSKENAIVNAESLKNNPETAKPNPLSPEFKEYWYAGEAEITSYKLEQARYGELREGHAVLIFVTEPFLADKQVKADRSNSENIQVLKFNSTKKYFTGIYPYSIMSSSFYPVQDNQHAVKISSSIQEWCGHVYAQLNNREDFEYEAHSYFEGEADEEFKMEKNILENELWNKLRINPNGLPQGELQIIPSLEYIRLTHKEIKPYKAMGSLTQKGEMSSYSVTYPELERTLIINFSTTFPYTIESWSDEFKSGFGANAKTLKSKATKIKTITTPYWRQNSNADIVLRESLGL